LERTKKIRNDGKVKRFVLAYPTLVLTVFNPQFFDKADAIGSLLQHPVLVVLRGTEAL
jgi:hypothetical protein